jgi:hypothetical protein
MEFDFDEAKNIITDKNNPYYTRYHANDRDVNDAVTRAYMKQFPGTIDLSGDGELERKLGDAVRAEINSIRNDPTNPKHQAYLDGNPEVTAHVENLYRQIVAEKQSEGLTETAKAGMEALRQEWGGEFKDNLDSAHRVIASLDQKTLEALHGDFPGLADDPLTINFLSRVGRREWDEPTFDLARRIEEKYRGTGDDKRVQEIIEQLQKRFAK